MTDTTSSQHDQTNLRDRIAAVLRAHASLGGAPPRYELPFFDGSTPSLPRITGWRPLDDVVAAVLAVLPAPTDRATVLLRDVEAYLSAQHSHGWHDQMAANLGCAGCELRDRITAALPTLAAPTDRAAEECDSLGREADRLRKDWVAMRTRAEQAEAKVADYENRITWHTTCASCARVLDSAIRETERAERAEAELRRMADEAQPETVHAAPDLSLATLEARQNKHVCKPGAGYYYCPTSARVESDCHGGFDVCCDRPDLHMPATAARQDGGRS
ncbi:hypothetical protein [Streptomyces longwoodensis]|uniref:hypothetical protein n=1 Tax=Streptomyces longwoodensis TaxID=68231 RepID=UPI00224EC7C4|nr:hypothetical protein [Streptomyces longwoodensis]MCX5000920.1 hypothetical protein [Streptomyces longwoodensis]